MTLNGAIMQLVELSEHPRMPVIFKPLIQKVIETISELEENPEPHWIPVEQELPEQDEICLVCGKNGGIYVARFWSNGNLVLWTKTGTGKFVNAVAWMPLLAPWKGERRNEPV